jgi:hypothetical protein
MNSPGKKFKWIIFRILNYIHVVVGFFVVLFAVVGNWPLHFSGIEEVLGFLLAVIAFGIFVANGLSNLYLVEKFYPDQLPPRTTSRFNLTMYVLMIIVSSVLTIAMFAILFQAFDSYDSDITFSIVALVILGSLVVTSIPLWFLQAGLRSTLKRNYYTTFDQFLENDELPGSETE